MSRNLGARQIQRRGRSDALGNSGTDQPATVDAAVGQSQELQALSQFPHQARIEAEAGVSIPGQSIVDPQLSQGGGPLARTTDMVTTFATARPSLAVAAHEAAHQLQHAGHTGDGGLGAELHAEAFSDAVAAGGGAGSLVGPGGSPVTGRTHDYTVIDDATQKARKEWEIGSDARVGDQGKTVTSDSSAHECYADADLLKEANEILTAKRSGVSLAAGAKTVSGPAPDGSGVKTLVDVVPTITTHMGGGTQTLWTDCGRSSREVMGETGSDSPPRAISADGKGVTEETRRATASPQILRDEVFVNAGLGADAATARAAYFALPQADREAFDKEHQINDYAAPQVGEAFVSARHDQALQPGDNVGFNFHWGGVIMVAGPDRVTFENFAKPGTTYDSKDDNWYFETRGPGAKAGQTFHDQNRGSVGGDVADDNITMATTNANHADVANRMSTRLLFTQIAQTDRAEQKAAYQTELETRQIKVTVKVVASDDIGKDDLYVTVGGEKSKTVSVAEGDQHAFLMPLKPHLPLTGALDIRLDEEDVVFDDAVFNFKWAPDGAAKTESDSHYSLTIDYE